MGEGGVGGHTAGEAHADWGWGGGGRAPAGEVPAPMSGGARQCSRSSSTSLNCSWWRSDSSSRARAIMPWRRGRRPPPASHGPGRPRRSGGPRRRRTLSSRGPRAQRRYAPPLPPPSPRQPRPRCPSSRERARAEHVRHEELVDGLVNSLGVPEEAGESSSQTRPQHRLRDAVCASGAQVDGVEGVALGDGIGEDAAHIIGDDNPRRLSSLDPT
jgi:hypothetical protein